MSPTRREGAAPPRVLLVDKPEGPTSHDVVRRVRRALEVRRVGHTGTLDPFASGLLLACVGRATRLAEYFHLLSKTYEAELVLGVETDTHDRTGEPVRFGEWRRVTEAGARAALAAHTGTLRQRPPVFSAVRVGGRRAHAMSRAGDPPELAEREVAVHQLTLREWTPPELTLRAVVSTGTYVRALARDIGRALGCGAHLGALRRTRIGPFEVEQALAADALEPGTPLPAAAALDPARALAWLPARELGREEASRAAAGGAVPRGTILDPELPEGPREGTPVRLLWEGRLLGVAEAASGKLIPRKVLA